MTDEIWDMANRLHRGVPMTADDTRAGEVAAEEVEEREKFGYWKRKAELLERDLDEVTTIAERNGVLWCVCSRADRMHGRARPECPRHGTSMLRQRDEARADRDRLAAGVRELAALTEKPTVIVGTSSLHLTYENIRQKVRALLAPADDGEVDQ